MLNRNLAVLGILATIMAGCAKPPPPAPPPPPPPPPPLPPHLGGPPAAQCSVVPFTVADGGTVTVSMTLSDDGGYCAATLVSASGKPFDAPLVPVRPLHGHETVVKYNGKTSVEYSADKGYTGSDQFTVKLISKGTPGYTTLNMAITVVAPHA